MATIQIEMPETPVDAPEEERVCALVDLLGAYIEAYHGGSVAVVSYDGATLRVRWSGACVRCPLSPSTLHSWIEGNVKQFFPNVQRVEAV